MSPAEQRWTLTLDGNFEPPLMAVIGPRVAPGECIDVVPAARLAEVEAERDRLRRRTHEIAEAKDAEHREAIGELARLRHAIDEARERTRDWDVAWTTDPPAADPYGWWRYTSSVARMDVVALIVARDHAHDEADDLRRALDTVLARAGASRPSASPNGSTAGSDSARPRPDAGCASSLDRNGDFGTPVGAIEWHDRDSMQTVVDKRENAQLTPDVYDEAWRVARESFENAASIGRPSRNTLLTIAEQWIEDADLAMREDDADSTAAEERIDAEAGAA